jgi:rhodanese-related sulfurtransferase
MSLLSLFGFGKNKIKEALRNGAVIIDVRTPREYDDGHIPQSINIPVDRINSSAQRIKGMEKPVIFCCASGARSGQAVSVMKQQGLKEVYNGGNWQYVLKLMNSL